MKGSCAGHMPLRVLTPLQTKTPRSQSQLMLNEVENNNSRTRAATVTSSKGKLTPNNFLGQSVGFEHWDYLAPGRCMVQPA